MTKLVRYAVSGLALLAAILAMPWLTRATPGRACRQSCGGAVATCVQQGYRERFCAREVMQLCRHGSTMCSVTPTTTIPTCVTTTTLPSLPGACLGAAGCAVDPSGITSSMPSADVLRQRLLGVWYDCKKAGSSEPFGAD